MKEIKPIVNQKLTSLEREWTNCGGENQIAKSVMERGQQTATARENKFEYNTANYYEDRKYFQILGVFPILPLDKMLENDISM